MRILITGVGGFVGGHLYKHILETTPEADIHGFIIEDIPPPHLVNSGVTCHTVDLKNEQAVSDLFQQVQPEQIYHLAAQASPRRSFSFPWETLENNILAQLNMILASLKMDVHPRMLVISSAEIYGPVLPEQMPIKEDAALKPTNPYGVSKVAQDMLGLQYFLSHHLPILRARPFNHFGPGQSTGFVATDFAIQIAKIEAGQQAPAMEVGNLSAQRDFSDVRDVVRAYRLIMEKGLPGEVYNIASGKATSIRTLLDIMLQHSSVLIEVRTDPARMMPIDVPIIVGDASHLREITGWQPTISFEKTVLDVLNDYRNRVSRP